MSTPSILKLRFTIPSAMQDSSTEGVEGKSYILTLALSIEAEADDMSCAEQIGLELVPSFWLESTSTAPTAQNGTLPPTDPNPG